MYKRTKSPMFNKEQEVKTNDAIAYQVYETKDYSKFRTLIGNRRINLLHVKRLIQSFTQKYLVSPIIVNEKFEVIDGQHRLKAAIETGTPVYYIVIPGYYLDEIQIYNVNQKNWTKVDYLKMYCDLGCEEYLKFKIFMERFPDFGIQASERILTQTATGTRSGNVDGITAQMRDFENGDFVVRSIHDSYNIARKIMEFKPYYKNFSRGTFISALLGVLKSKHYTHKEMISKLEVCPEPLADQANVTQYKLVLERIYNYKRRNDQKVSLQYE